MTIDCKVLKKFERKIHSITILSKEKKLKRTDQTSL